MWEKVLRKVNAGQMPPAGMPRPSAAATAAFTKSLGEELDRAAAALVEPLIRQTILEFRNSADFPLDADEQRERVLACFIQRYRRHVRLICANDEEGEWSLSAPGSPPGNVRTAIHRLPLELRESLLLVVLEGFSHARAAATLEIGLAQLMDVFWSGGETRQTVEVEAGVLVEGVSVGAVVQTMQGRCRQAIPSALSLRLPRLQPITQRH